jgi:translation elongation factor EF-Ts
MISIIGEKVMRVSRVQRLFSGRVTTEQVRLLRDMTGAPLLQCKNILTECAGDIDKAKAVLREKNLLFADKKLNAHAKEGVAFHFG